MQKQGHSKNAFNERGQETPKRGGIQGCEGFINGKPEWVFFPDYREGTGHKRFQKTGCFSISAP